MAKLGDFILDIAAGPFGSNLKVECFIPQGFPIIDGANLKGFKVTDNITKFVTEEKARSLHRSIAKRNDVVVTISGNVGQISYIPEDSKYREYLVSQRQFRVSFNTNKVYVPYLIYYFHTNEGQHKILSFANQTGVPALAQPLKNFRNIDIELPDIKIQRKIASILSALDDKIECNTRINLTLEEQAQAIFKSRFIDFEPYFKGDLIESEIGLIPKGWTIGVLSDIANINPTRVLKKGHNSTYLDMKNMPTSGPFPFKWEMKEYSGGMKFQNQDTLMARITPCLENGKVAYVNFLQDNEVAFGSTEYIVMTSKDGYIPELLYFLCRDEAFKGYATKNMNGSSGRQRVSGETIGNYKIAIPPRSVIESVAGYYKTVMDVFKNNGLENLALSNLRDTLLPRLMSGEIKV